MAPGLRSAAIPADVWMAGPTVCCSSQRLYVKPRLPHVWRHVRCARIVCVCVVLITLSAARWRLCTIKKKKREYCFLGFFFSQFLKHVWWLCACEITFPLWKKKKHHSFWLDAAACVHILPIHTRVRLCVFHAVSVCIPVYSCQCEAPLSFQPGVHVYWYLDVCARTWDRTLSYGLHAVTAESRLWDVPGCQEYPPPILYRLAAFHSSVWMQMQSASSLASSCHLETEPSASSSAWCEIRRLLPPYLLVCFTNVYRSLTKF